MTFIRSEEGKVVKYIAGTRFTTVTFTGGMDVRTNKCGLSDEELQKLLADVFGIVLNKPLKFNSIVSQFKKAD